MYFSRSRRAFCIFLSTLMVVSTFPITALRADDTEIKYYSVEESNKYEVEQVTTSTWEGHANIELKIRNTGDEIIDNWYITFETPYIIENIWNATIVETDNNGTYTIRNNYYNQDIGIDSEVTIGVTISLCDAELGNFSDWYFLNTKTYEVESDKYYISYQEYSKWDDGFNGALMLSSIDYIEDWSLSFDSEYEITTISNAVIESTEGGTYTITNDGSSQNISSNMLLLSIQGIPTENDFAIGNVIMSSVGLAYGLSDDEDNNGIADYSDFIYSIEDIDPITPTPTNEPTITSIPTITEEPTKEPIITIAPTPTEEPDPEKDSDEDGLPDWLEIELGTDIEEIDSDFDNLSDFIEYLIGYDPTDPDTDKNGIPDGDEDYDGDCITNVQEIELGTELYLEDSDFDLLNDGDEIEIYGTDPTKYDTDGDEISDGDEVAMGKDPSDPNDKNIKVSQTKIFEIKNDSAPELSSVEVSIDLSENIEIVADVEDLYGKQVYLSELRGRIGSPIDITCTEDFETAVVTFHYDDSVLGETNEDDLILLWYNEDNGLFIEQEQAILDTIENSITVELEHFSKYIIVDSRRWYSHVDFYGYETETYTGYYDYYYAFDISSKMTPEARESAWNSFVEFTDNMRSGDRVVPLLFSSSSCLYYAPMMTKDHVWFDDMMDATENYVKYQIKDDYSCYYRAFSGVVNVNDPRYNLVDDIGNRKHLIIISSDSEPESIFNEHIDYMRDCMAYTGFTVSIYNTVLSMSGTAQIFSPGKAYADQLLLEYRVDSPIPLPITYAPDYSVDKDKDGLPDYIEENGMFCVGTEDKTICTDTNPELNGLGKAIGYDSDDDGLSDKEEMGIQYSVSMSDRGYITIKNGDSVLGTFMGTINDNSEYKCFRPYVPAAGKTVTVYAPIADPNNPDTDGDKYVDSIDLHPNYQAYDYTHFDQVSDLNVNIPYIESYFLEDQYKIDSDYNINSAYAEDLYSVYNALRAVANLSDQTLLHSSSALNHYLDNSGEVYGISLSELIYLNEVPCNRDKMISVLEAMKRKNITYTGTCSIIATLYYYENMFHLLKHAKSVLKDGDSITIMQVLNENEEITSFKINETYQMIDLDWLLTLGVGGSKAGVVAKVTRLGDEYSIFFHYCVYDVYDWELEFSIVPWMPSDDEIGELHTAGLAKEYIVFGDNTSFFSFDGKAIDSLSSLLGELI